MKRKVIQLAHKTLVVSLPSKWARNYGVKKGAELEVEERGQQIVFSTSKRSDYERLILDTKSMGAEMLRRWVLSSLHKTGYDEIEIIYEDDSVLKTIQDAMREYFLGFAVVDQGRNKCVIRVVAEEQEKEFESILRRAFLVTKNMGEAVHNYLQEGKSKKVDELLALEKTNNQLTNFCERILNKRGYSDDRKRSFIYVVVWNLEKVCDVYKNICNYALESSKIGKKVIEQIKKANDYYNSYYELFYKFDASKLEELDRQRVQMTKENIGMLKKSKGTDSLILASLMELTEKTADFSASFIALNTPRTS